MNSLTNWLLRPETIVSVLLSTLVSLYAKEIRQSLSVPGRKLRFLRIALWKTEFELLAKLHGNTSEILVYVVWHVGLVGLYVVAAGLLAVLLSSLSRYANFSLNLGLGIALAVLSGLSVGQVVALSLVLNGLYHYDERMGRLKERLFARLLPLENKLRVIDLISKPDREMVITNTWLLFPFVTNQTGFDTGIAISNVSVDPIGTNREAGTVLLYFYGQNAPEPISSASVSSGGQWVTLISTVARDFQGYIIAKCTFHPARGFAFISDIGAQKLAMGYLPEIIKIEKVVIRS